MIEYQELLMNAIDSIDLDRVSTIVDLVCSTIGSGDHIYVIGNGGNASTASHFACDLQKGASETKKVRAMSLCDNMALMTAWSNDFNFRVALSEQVSTMITEGDLLFAFSASGKSQNITEAVALATDNLATTIGISGFGGGQLSEEVHHPLIIQSDNMQVVEDVTMMVCHMIFRAVKKKVG
jgi:D-sedoheptulose 7-phosphate isomerase